jgi:hypothetical protein
MWSDAMRAFFRPHPALNFWNRSRRFWIDSNQNQFDLKRRLFLGVRRIAFAAAAAYSKDPPVMAG